MTEFKENNEQRATENPYLDRSALDVLEQRFRDKTATVADLQKLDAFMNGLGFKDYLLNKFIQNGVLSYELFIASRASSNEVDNKIVHNTLLGTIYGSIRALKDILSNN
jgi:hypothetical protein